MLADCKHVSAEAADLGNLRRASHKVSMLEIIVPYLAHKMRKANYPTKGIYHINLSQRETLRQNQAHWFFQVTLVLCLLVFHAGLVLAE